MTRARHPRARRRGDGGQVRGASYKAPSDIAYGAYGKIIMTTPRQRRNMLKALGKLTTTNCGWALWDMRGILAEFIGMASPRGERESRRRAAQKRAKGNRS